MYLAAELFSNVNYQILKKITKRQATLKCFQLNLLAKLHLDKRNLFLYLHLFNLNKLRPTYYNILLDKVYYFEKAYNKPQYNKGSAQVLLVYILHFFDNIRLADELNDKGKKIREGKLEEWRTKDKGKKIREGKLEEWRTNIEQSIGISSLL